MSPTSSSVSSEEYTPNESVSAFTNTCASSDPIPQSLYIPEGNALDDMFGDGTRPFVMDSTFPTLGTAESTYNFAGFSNFDTSFNDCDLDTFGSTGLDNLFTGGGVNLFPCPEQQPMYAPASTSNITVPLNTTPYHTYNSQIITPGQYMWTGLNIASRTSTDLPDQYNHLQIDPYLSYQPTTLGTRNNRQENSNGHRELLAGLDQLGSTIAILRDEVCHELELLREDQYQMSVAFGQYAGDTHQRLESIRSDIALSNGWENNEWVHREIERLTQDSEYVEDEPVWFSIEEP